MRALSNSRPPELAKKRKKWWLGYLLILPGVLLFGTFTYYPFGKTILYSFALTDQSAQFVKWVGLGNWTRILGKSEMWQILRTTLAFAGMNLVLTFGIAMVFALLCVKNGKGSRIYQTLFALPMAIASSPAAAIWLFIYRQDAGILNELLGTHVAWIRETATALPAVSIVTAWMHIGSSFIYLLVGFRNVPTELLEAATIDGASSWQRAIRIMIPMASPQIFFVLFLNITSAFRSFAQIKLMTGGGPAGATKTLIHEVYTEAMVNGRFMNACVYALILFLLIFLTTRVQFLMEKRMVHYQ
ncbi:MAG: sugar ABC transporter permease [Oscillospiraceae bacterium]|nr:sugar ABC transporter permease [Oscillospiraceae bacterium]